MPRKWVVTVGDLGQWRWQIGEEATPPVPFTNVAFSTSAELAERIVRLLNQDEQLESLAARDGSQADLAELRKLVAEEQ